LISEEAALIFPKSGHISTMLETPRQLAARFERGEIERHEFQALMALHARELIQEIEEEHHNPLAAWLESRLARASVKKLLKKHSASQIREILSALAEAPGFPLAKYLWNASHPDVPLHCFFRIRKSPVFQILSITTEGNTVELHLEIHATRNRQRITLTRDANWQLSAPSFSRAEGQA
jgi:hypothetical protein